MESSDNKVAPSEDKRQSYEVELPWKLALELKCVGLITSLDVTGLERCRNDNPYQDLGILCVVLWQIDLSESPLNDHEKRKWVVSVNHDEARVLRNFCTYFLKRRMQRKSQKHQLLDERVETSELSEVLDRLDFIIEGRAQGQSLSEIVDSIIKDVSMQASDAEIARDTTLAAEDVASIRRFLARTESLRRWLLSKSDKYGVKVVGSKFTPKK